MKFVSYEEGKTNKYLEDRTVWFSKPNKLNDYFEMGYIHPRLDNDEIFETLLNTYLTNSDLKCSLLEELRKSIHVKSFVDKLIDDIDDNNPLTDDQKTVLLEQIAYESVGICCFSDILVLLDNSLSIMLAHYGEKLCGLALIYEINNSSLRKVNYLQSKRRPGSAGSAKRIRDWFEGNYNEYSNFIYKSDKWAYEAEYRLFATPGAHKQSDHDISLKAILHTPRLGGATDAAAAIRQKLEEINHEYYENGLKIVEVGPSYSKFEFQLADDTGQDLGEWVKENFLELYSPDEWQLITNVHSEALYQNHLGKFYGYETEQLKQDILSLRQFISQGKVNEQVFIGMHDGKNDTCFFNVRKLPKPNALSENEVILMIDDFYIHDSRKWLIAEKLFEMLKKYANGIPIYVQNHGEGEMTNRFLKKQNGIRILEIFKIHTPSSE